MVSDKIITLVRRLFQMTMENKLAWEETAHEGVYQLGIEDYIVRVAVEKQEDAAKSSKYVLRICNAKGTVLDQITDADISERIHDPETFMKDLYQRARRAAMGVETALDRIIHRLEGEQPPEPL